jgi:hypothetical protein
LVKLSPDHVKGIATAAILELEARRFAIVENALPPLETV